MTNVRHTNTQEFLGTPLLSEAGAICIEGFALLVLIERRCRNDAFDDVPRILFPVD